VASVRIRRRALTFGRHASILRRHRCPPARGASATLRMRNLSRRWLSPNSQRTRPSTFVWELPAALLLSHAPDRAAAASLVDNGVDAFQPLLTLPSM
jgi:hypothetical protein